MKLVFFFQNAQNFVQILKNAIKFWEYIFCFSHNSVSTCCGNFSYLWRKYMWSAVNVLPNSPKIWHITKRGVFQLNFSWIYRKLGSECYIVSFSSVWYPWTRSFWKAVEKEELSGIEVTTFLWVNKFRNI